MSTQFAHARALRLIQEQGATEDQARTLLRRLQDAGWTWREREPHQVEPSVREKADDEVRATYLASMRADVAAAKRTLTTVTPEPDPEE